MKEVTSVHLMNLIGELGKVTNLLGGTKDRNSVCVVRGEIFRLSNEVLKVLWEDEKRNKELDKEGGKTWV